MTNKYADLEIDHVDLNKVSGNKVRVCTSNDSKRVRAAHNVGNFILKKNVLRISYHMRYIYSTFLFSFTYFYSTFFYSVLCTFIVLFFYSVLRPFRDESIGRWGESRSTRGKNT